VVALYFQLIHPNTGLPEISTHLQLVLGVAITTIGWVIVTFLTKPTDDDTLRSFYKLVQPGGPGWQSVLDRAKGLNISLDGKKGKWDVPQGILCMVLGCLAVYSTLFATGYWIYGNTLAAIILSVVAISSAFMVSRAWKRLSIG